MAQEVVEVVVLWPKKVQVAAAAEEVHRLKMELVEVAAEDLPLP